MSDTENGVKTEEAGNAEENIFSTPPSSAKKVDSEEGEDFASPEPFKNGEEDTKESTSVTPKSNGKDSTASPAKTNSNVVTMEKDSSNVASDGATEDGKDSKEAVVAVSAHPAVNGETNGKDSASKSENTDEKTSTSTPTSSTTPAATTSNGNGEQVETDKKASPSPTLKPSDMQLNPRVSAWKEKGNFLKFRDYDIFYYLQTGSKVTPLVVLLHGYPSSSFDFREYLSLEKEHSILCLDLLGFGLSDKPNDHDYTLSWQADLVEEAVRQLNPTPNGPVFIVAHDMSTSVASELFARDLEEEGKLSINVIGALLFNGNMIMDRAKLILGQKLLRTKFGPLFSRVTNSVIYRWQLGSVFSREHAMSREEGDDQWNLQCYKGGQRILHKLISYTFERVKHAERWHGAIKNWKKPMSFAWGMEDPVSTTNQFEGWKNLRPHADAHEMPGLGHYPQIENPKVFKDVVDAVLEKLAEQK